MVISAPDGYEGKYLERGSLVDNSPLCSRIKMAAAVNVLESEAI